jgi:hypothetical protein
MNTGRNSMLIEIGYMNEEVLVPVLTIAQIIGEPNLIKIKE